MHEPQFGNSNDASRVLAAIDLAALTAVFEGTAGSIHDQFFSDLVRHLAGAMGVENAMLAEFAGEGKVRTIALWSGGRLVPNIEYDLEGTPCKEVVAGNECHYARGVADAFPQDVALKEMGIESYFGVPLLGSDGAHLGHLCVFDRRPLPAPIAGMQLFRIFSARATAELSRLQIERKLLASEQRFRDLFEEAPIAYVNEGLDSKFISANRAAMRILGITPEEVPHTVGMSFIPNTPDAQKRVQEAFASIGRGTDTGGVVLELRRKDNGKPIWIQWWSKPEPGGQYTRTMFVDITEQVLAEQEKARLSAQNIYLQEEIKSVHNFEEIIGRSDSLVRVLEQVERVAGTDATVLITGETGTGKELIARAIHSASPRRDRPLIKLNCAALPASLVESELFGHEKGAFSGAIQQRLGRFELAQGGTIFLDEIGELPLDVQAKLLRVLQEREFERIGGSSSIKIDVRVIAATNRDLLKAIREGTFREDLFYRLNVFPVMLPPLRARPGDVELLARFLVAKFAGRVGRRIEAISPETVRRLVEYHWPGNIREMENILERAVILSSSAVLEIQADVFIRDASDPAAAPQSAETPAASLASGESHAGTPGPETNEPLSLEQIERKHILSVLERCRWVIDGPKGAARVLNLHPNTLRSRLKKLGIQRNK